MNKKLLRRLLPLVVPIALLVGISAPVADLLGVAAEAIVSSGSSGREIDK